MIRFTCECGKTLQAREENSGKTVICPSCQRQLTVPGTPSEATAIQAEEPSGEDRIRKERIESPAAADLEREYEDEEMEDRPVSASGNSRKAVASLVLGILSLFCSVLAGLPALILGILALGDIGRSRGRLGGHGLAIGGIVSACVGTMLSCVLLLPALLLPAVQKVRVAAARSQSANNLKQMGLALHMYQDTYRSLPAAGVGDPNKPLAKKPLLSWRVAILPFIEQQHLYQQFKLNEPWNSPNNIRLLPLMPKIYDCPAVNTTPGETIYQVFVGDKAAFDKTVSRRIPADFPDGTSNTIFVALAAKPVPWTKPEDIPFDPNQPIAPLLNNCFRNVHQVLLVDGSVSGVTTAAPESTLKAMITRNGNEPIPRP